MQAGSEAMNLATLERLVAQAVATALPQAIAGLRQPVISPVSAPTENTAEVGDPELDPSASSRNHRFFEEEKHSAVANDLFGLTKKAFTTALSKEKWKEVLDTYPPVEGTETILSSPRMEAGMKADLTKHYGNKAKEVLAFDEGIIDKQNAFF